MITISIPCQFLAEPSTKIVKLNWNMFSLQTRVWRKQKIMAYWLVCIQHHHLISLLSCVCSANSAELSKLSQPSKQARASANSNSAVRKNTTYSEEEAWNAWQGTSRTCCRKPLAVICMPAPACHSSAPTAAAAANSQLASALPKRHLLKLTAVMMGLSFAWCCYIACFI